MSEKRQGNHDNDPLLHGNSEEKLKAILAMDAFRMVHKIEEGFLNDVQNLLEGDTSKLTSAALQDLKDVLEGPERFYHTVSDEINFGSVPIRLGFISTISDDTRTLGYWFNLEPADKKESVIMVRLMDESPPIIMYKEAMRLADEADKDHHRVRDVPFFLECAIRGEGARLCGASDLAELIQILGTTKLDIEKMKVV